MTTAFRRLMIVLGLILAISVVPSSLDAASLTVATGTSFTFWGIITRIIGYLAGAISAVAMAMFIVGAFFYTLAGAKEDYKQKGKDLMLGSILSLAVVFGAYAILRTVDYFLSN